VYGGHGLRTNEKQWTISELEGLAMVEGIRSNHVYLAHKPFEIITDHRALVFIKTMRLPSIPRLTRMSLFLQGYNFSINYKPGCQNTAADALSRIPRENEILKADDEIIAMINDNNDRVTINFDRDDDECLYDVNNVTSIDDITLPTIEEIKDAIKDCPDFGPMLAYLDRGVLPSMDDVARKIVLKSQEYVLHQGILYHLYTPRTRRLDSVVHH